MAARKRSARFARPTVRQARNDLEAARYGVTNRGRMLNEHQARVNLRNAQGRAARARRVQRRAMSVAGFMSAAGRGGRSQSRRG